MVKKIRVTIFRELNFCFRGHPRKFIVHKDKMDMDEYGRALCVRDYGMTAALVLTTVQKGTQSNFSSQYFASATIALKFLT